MAVKFDDHYFLMGFRFNKTLLEDFGLVQSTTQDHIFIRDHDQTRWMRKELYDLGWGNEIGFVRLRELSFDDLWQLLILSNLQENLYGAAAELHSKCPDELRQVLIEILTNQSHQINSQLKKAFKILNLERPINRGIIEGLTYKEIDDRFKEWEFISLRVKQILS